MIRGAPGTENGNVVALPDANEIHGKFFVQVLGDGVLAVLRAEYAMDETSSRHFRTGLSHGVPSALAARRRQHWVIRQCESCRQRLVPSGNTNSCVIRIVDLCLLPVSFAEG